MLMILDPANFWHRINILSLKPFSQLVFSGILQMGVLERILRKEQFVEMLSFQVKLKIDPLLILVLVFSFACYISLDIQFLVLVLLCTILFAILHIK